VVSPLDRLHDILSWLSGFGPTIWGARRTHRDDRIRDRRDAFSALRDGTRF